METIPFHIQETAKLYPVLASTINNYADGHIENWTLLFNESKEDLPRPGLYVPIRANITLSTQRSVNYGEVWVYLGSGYFKQVLKRKLHEK